jgi:hypothetical protein
VECVLAGCKWETWGAEERRVCDLHGVSHLCVGTVCETLNFLLRHLHGLIAVEYPRNECCIVYRNASSPHYRNAPVDEFRIINVPDLKDFGDADNKEKLLASVTRYMAVHIDLVTTPKFEEYYEGLDHDTCSISMTSEWRNELVSRCLSDCRVRRSPENKDRLRCVMEAMVAIFCVEPTALRASGEDLIHRTTVAFPFLVRVTDLKLDPKILVSILFVRSLDRNQKTYTAMHKLISSALALPRRVTLDNLPLVQSVIDDMYS